MKQFLETAKDIALDKIADNLTDALTSAAGGGKTAADYHIGQAASDILDLSNIVHDLEKPDEQP